MSAFQRAACYGCGKSRSNFAIQVLALWLESFQRGKFCVIRPGGVVRDEIQIEEIVGRCIEIFGMGITGIELSKRNPLVTADVLDAELAAFFPDRISQFLVVEPPALLLGGIECIEFQAR